MKDFKILIISSLLITAIAFAQWSTDPATPQSLGSGVQAQLAATSDGGVYVAWLSDGNYHVYLQRLNSLGESQWSDNGMVVSDNANASWIAVYHLNLAVDSEDNAIITTVDQRTGGQWEVYAYKIAPDGSMLWGDDGVALTASGVSNMSPRLTVLLDNSVVVTWTHNDNSVLFQRISSAGALLWGTGILIVEDGASLLSPQPIVTEEDVLIQWIRQTGPFWAANSELYLQRYDYDGNPQWINPIVAAGPVVFPMGNWSQQSVADGDNGSFSAWTEMSGSVQAARVQHITGVGVLSWTGGADLSANSNNFHISPQLTVANDTQELMAIWKEKTGSQSQIGVYAQRLDSGGNQLWGSNGTAVVALNSDYDYLDISVAGFEEDIIATYIEQSVNMNGDIYAARLDADGNDVWAGGAATVTNSGIPKSDMMIAEGPGCLFIAWTEGSSVYAHCLREDGTLGAPDNEPSTTYVPDDNFEQALIDLGYDDVLNDSVLTANISGVTSLDVNDKSISDLTGIEAFTALSELSCEYNQLTSLDVNSNTALTVLICNVNQLTALDVSNNTALTNLWCDGNQLTSLDVNSNTALTNLQCGDNQLTSLDVNSNTALTVLICNVNQLTALDVSNNTALTHLNCVDNQLTYLNMRNGVTDALTTFDATNNSLTCIETLDPAYASANWTSSNGNIDAGVTFNVICGAEEQTHWYVDTAGSDAQGSGTLTSPLATIQTAINASTESDTVSVGAGTYVENINYKGKNIVVRGEDRETTIIDGNNAGRVVTFNSGEDTTAVLSGFSIMFGQGGVEVTGSSPKLEDLLIAYNQADQGGGLKANGSQLIIKDCELYFNFAYLGGGIFFNDTESDLTNVTIAYCYGDSASSIFIATDCILEIKNCTFYRDISLIPDNGYLGAQEIVYGHDNQFSIINCVYTKTSDSYGVFLDYDGSQNYGEPNNNTCSISFSSIHGMSESSSFGSYGTLDWDELTNIGGNPLLCLTDSTDFALAENSPCVGTGENGANMGAFGVGCGIINQVLNVPADYATIQAGIDAAFDGDTVLVAAGTYVENIYFSENMNNWSYLGKDIVVGSHLLIYPDSLDLINSTIIDGGQNGYVVGLKSGENNNAEIYGFTITNGSGSGGGVLSRGGKISYCFIYGNIGTEGGGIYASHYGYGATYIDNVTVTQNSTYGIGMGGNTLVVINNSIIRGNEGNDDWPNLSDEIYGEGWLVTATYSNITSWLDYYDGEGMIDADPLFCNPDSSNYTLAQNSPCVGTGENGANMGAFGVGCGPIILAPVLSDIDDQQITEDDSITIVVSATSDINASMSFTATSDTSDVSVTMDSTTLTSTPAQDWNGSSLITVIVIDENGLSDTTDFTLTVNVVNDSPEEFSVIYPTVSDTFSTHADNDTLIQFRWGKSNDVDSDVTYKLTIELEYFGNTYTDIHENISDTTISVSSNSLDPMLDVTSQDEAVFTYYVHASDEVYIVASDVGEFVLSRAALGAVDGYAIPEQFSLHQNYPNPFNPITTLRYDLPEDALVNITIYDMMGRQVKTLINSQQNAGFKSVRWNASNDYGKPVSAGIYLYMIQTGDFRQTKKMVLLK